MYTRKDVNSQKIYAKPKHHIRFQSPLLLLRLGHLLLFLYRRAVVVEQRLLGYNPC